MALITASFMSKSLMRTVPVNIIMPTDKLTFPGQPEPSNEPKKLLVLLHGVFGSYVDWVTGTRVQAFAEAHDLAVVMPSGDNKFYCDSSTTGDRYGTFIGVELVDFMRKTFNVSNKREDTYIAGLSMGGFGAIVNGLRHPETFGCIAGLSSGLIKQNILSSVDEPGHDIFTRTQYRAIFGLDKIEDYNGSENDYDALADKVASDPNKPKIYLCCGLQDWLLEPNRAYRDKLKGLGYDVTWAESAGGHTWEFWGEYIEKVINWLPLGGENAGISSGNVGI